MAHATEMNSATPMPTVGNVHMQLEGMAMAGVYVSSFVWFHRAAGAAFLDTKVLAVFFVGLIVVPLLAALPVFLLRRLVVGTFLSKPGLASFLPFARFSLYALQWIAVWAVTREVHERVFASALLA